MAAKRAVNLFDSVRADHNEHLHATGVLALAGSVTKDTDLFPPFGGYPQQPEEVRLNCMGLVGYCETVEMCGIGKNRN